MIDKDSIKDLAEKDSKIKQLLEDIDDDFTFMFQGVSCYCGLCKSHTNGRCFIGYGNRGIPLCQDCFKSLRASILLHERIFELERNGEL